MNSDTVFDSIRTKKLRILVVYDCKTTRATITGILNHAGYSAVRSTENPDEAVKLIIKRNFDVVLLDWHMPQMSGIRIIKLVRRHKINIPVIMVTGETAQASVMHALKSGATDYLIKPVTAHALEEKLYLAQKHIDKQRVSPDEEGL